VAHGSTPARRWPRGRGVACAVVAAWLCVLFAPASAGALDEGPLSVEAVGFQYLRHDVSTGQRALAIEAGSAGAAGDEVRLRNVSLVRYREGRPALTATSRAGLVKRDAGAVLEGGVELTWRGDSAEAVFEVDALRYERRLGAVRSHSSVTGVIGGTAEDGGEVRLILDGNGLLAGSPGRGAGDARVLRDVVLEVSGATDDPWVISADGGVQIESAANSTTLRFAGPVEGRSARLTWSADEVELVLAAARGGELRLVRAFASGNVNASGTHPALAGRAPGDGDGRDARFRAAAVAAEVGPDGDAVFLGTIADPARVAFTGGELRGTRLVLARDAVSSSGGATSVFVWDDRP